MKPRTSSPLRQTFLGVATFCLLVMILIVGKPILAPIALATIMAFVLFPIVNLIERRGINRLIAVGAAMFIVVSVSVVLGAGLVSQIRTLASDFPTHAAEIRVKHDALRAWAAPLLQRPIELMNRGWATPNTEPRTDGNRSTESELTAAATATDKPSTASAAAPSKPDSSKSERIETDEQVGTDRRADAGDAALSPLFQQSSGNPLLQWIPTVLRQIVEPFANAGLVVVLATFILLRREDLRNRFLALLGRTRLAHSTHVLEDASSRLSGYLLGLVSVNLGFSVAFTIGLTLLGVPYAVLWGAISFFARFVPIIGSAVSMLAPLLIAVAAVPGWLAPIGVISLYLALEGITSNVVEPWLYGKSVGMNPVAIWVAFMFWTWAWGFLGLALSTPLTLILVTLSMHLPQLGWLKLLLGDSHPLPKSMAFYQRLLAQDRHEADRFLRAAVEKRGPNDAMQTLLLPALRRADRELHSGVIGKQEYDVLVAEANVAVDWLIAHAVAEQTNKYPTLQIATFGFHNPRAENGLRLLLASQDQGDLIPVEKWTSRSVRHLLSQTPDIVLLSITCSAERDQAIAIAKTLRQHGYRGWLVLGWWKGKSLRQSTRTQLKEAGFDYVTHRLRAMDRMLRYAAENSAAESEESVNKQTVADSQAASTSLPAQTALLPVGQ